MISRLFNNVGIFSLAIVFTTQRQGGTLAITRALLVAPFISHRAMLSHLARKNLVDPSLEGLLIDRPEYFSNFNSRFYDGLTTSVNAIQFLVDVEIAEIASGALRINSPISYDRKMGERALKIERASSNIASLLTLPTSSLYSSLRIQL